MVDRAKARESTTSIHEQGYEKVVIKCVLSDCSFSDPNFSLFNIVSLLMEVINI